MRKIKKSPDTIYVQPAKDQVTLGKKSPSTAAEVKSVAVDKAVNPNHFAPSEKLLDFIAKSGVNDDGMYYFSRAVKDLIKEKKWENKRYLDSLRTPEWQARENIVAGSYSDFNLGATHVRHWWMGEARQYYNETGQPAVITQKAVETAYGPDTYAARYVFNALADMVQKGSNRVEYGKPAIYFTVQE